MNRLALLLPLALAACASGPVPLPPPDAEVRPVTAKDVLAGRWDIVSVNGRASPGLWLELGEAGGATDANLGCNMHRAGGWSRNGDKLFLTAPLTGTEMACLDPQRSAAETQALAVLRLAMTMELTPPDALRLINEAGTLDLVRKKG